MKMAKKNSAGRSLGQSQDKTERSEMNERLKSRPVGSATCSETDEIGKCIYQIKYF